MKPVLVTGGAGHIGSNLTKYLVKEGFSVRVLILKNENTLAIDDLDVEKVEGDMLSLESLLKAMDGCEYVFHIAGHFTFWNKLREKSYKINTEGAKNICQAVIKKNIKKLTFNSTIGTIPYCKGKNDIPNEESPYNYEPLHIVYNDVKKATEDIFLKASKEGVPVVLLNPTMVWGERDVNFSSARLFKFMKNPFLNKFYTIGGTGVVDADDLAYAHLKAIEKGKIGERYIINNENLTIKELLDMICEVMGIKKPIIPLNTTLVRIMGNLIDPFTNFLSKEPPFSRDMALTYTLYAYGNSEKARKELNYPYTPPIESIKKSYNWLKEKKLI